MISYLYTKLKDFNELVMFKHSIFSFPFIFIAMIVANDGLVIGYKIFILGILATLSARNFAMSFNRLVDIKFDAQNPRTQNRPSVDGRISKISIIVFTALNAFLFILVAYLINHLAFLLSIPVLFFLGFYSLVKRFSSLAHIFLGLTLAFAPLAGCIAISEAIYPWTIYLSIGVLFWVAGFDLLYSLQDIEFDKQNLLHSIPAKFGEAKTLKISQIFHLITTICWLIFAWKINIGIFSYIGVIIASIILFIEHKIVLKDFKNINRAFFTLNGYLGIIFLFFVILDYI